MTWLFFTGHEADVIREATARLVPGPEDAESEQGHPGAREANVVRYIDNLLGGLSADPPVIYASAPTRTGPPEGFLGLTEPQRVGWERRIARLRDAYRSGVRRLDRAAATGSFLSASAEERDEILASDELRDFQRILFTHTIEGMYAHPVYGGNADRCGWAEIGYELPDSYTAPADAAWIPTSALHRESAVEPLVEKSLPLAIQLLLEGDDDA